MGGEDARPDANEIDARHCRRNHSGCAPGAGPGYKLPISSTDRRGIGECQPGANDFGSSGEIAGGRLGSSPDRKGGHRTRAVG
jgi:hypothetical protein